MNKKTEKIINFLIPLIITGIIILITLHIISGQFAPEINDYWTKEEMDCYTKCGYQGLQINKAIFCSFDDSCVTCVCESSDWEKNQEYYRGEKELPKKNIWIANSITILALTFLGYAIYKNW